MKSIKYLLISIIILLAYDSNFPDTLKEMDATDYSALILFTTYLLIGYWTETKTETK